MQKTETLIRRLTSTKDPDTVRDLYRQWAESYESDLTEFGYVAPTLSVAAFSQAVPERSSLIYDAGCGTGIIGTLLNELGYTHIDGADFSPEMLKRATQSGVYEHLELADYSRSLETQSNHYDAIISVGVYTSRFEQVFLAEMLRILKPGGLLYFTCRPQYFESDAGAELQQLLLENKIESLQIQRKPYMVKEGADAFYIQVYAQNDTDN